MIGPVLFATTFAAAIARGRLPGAGFVLAAALTAAALAVAWRVARR
jgi:hypothetical protein